MMKKLIYLWVNNYKNAIIQQGYQLSPEILVETEVLPVAETGNIRLSIHMADNRCNVIKNFYGQNISSVMVFVGKNGSGKTLVSRMLLEYLPDGLRVNDSLNNPELLQSLSLGLEWDNRALYVLFDDEKEVVSVCPNYVSIIDIRQEWDIGEMEIKRIDQDKIYQELGSAVKTGIYLTNVFNPSELLESYHKLNLKTEFEIFQQSYSPAFFIKHEMEEQRKSLYGYRTADNRFIGVIERYAQRQMNSVSFAFMNKQAELFLKSYYHIPEKLKKELRIYREFEIDVIEFGTRAEVIPYVDTDGDFNELYESQDPYDKALILAKRIYISKKDKIGENVSTLLYFNMLLEIYGVLYGSSNSIEQRILELFEGEITVIDVGILNSIKDYILNELKDSGWANQISDFIDFLTDSQELTITQNWIGKTGKRSFSEKKFLDWYRAEITKEASFVKRNLIFRWRSASSGEIAIANLFSYLDDAVRNLKIQQNRKNVLLILDELDCYLHPRWQQYIAKIIFDRLQEYTECMFQIIITSHSPIILSDICKYNILKLDGFKAQLETKETFGADICHLYYDSFFMDEGDIGDFAKENIAYAIEELKKGNLSDKEKILFIINNIGQDVIRKRLAVKYQILQQQELLRDQETDTVKIAERIHALDAGKREKILNYINEVENTQKRIGTCDKNRDRKKHFMGIAQISCELYKGNSFEKLESDCRKNCRWHYSNRRGA